MMEVTMWIRAVRCDDIPVREGRAVNIASREIAIFNLGSRFLAVENRCPHKGGPLADGIVSGATVVCPLHAWKMSVETGRGVNSASAASCVQTFRTRVEQGVVLLEIPLQESFSQREGGIPAICLEPNSTSELSEVRPTS
jgi:nitrite reductase [NAD(P)H] small subunit